MAAAAHAVEFQKILAMAARLKEVINRNKATNKQNTANLKEVEEAILTHMLDGEEEIAKVDDVPADFGNGDVVMYTVRHAVRTRLPPVDKAWLNTATAEAIQKNGGLYDVEKVTKHIKEKRARSAEKYDAVAFRRKKPKTDDDGGVVQYEELGPGDAEGVDTDEEGEEVDERHAPPAL